MTQSSQSLRRKRAGKLLLFLGLGVLVVVLATLALVRILSSRILERATLEAGGELSVELFLARPEDGAVFVSDVASIDTTVPGDYPVEILLDRVTYRSILAIRDTTPPTAEAVALTVRRGELPAAGSCVEDVQDVTPVTVRYQAEPDVSSVGEQTAVILLTDTSGNTATVLVTITVIDDAVPPVIQGAHDIEAYVGDTISYREGIVVTDNMDESPVLEIDASQVDLTESGVYPVIYRATDAFGNTTEVEIALTLLEKPDRYVEPEVVYAMAGDILAEITDESMDDMQVAYAIYRWVRYNIAYTGTSDKSSWTVGAWDAFQERAGDCFNYFAAAKALLDVAGIENMDIVKSDTSHSAHYWNLVDLGGGWYHFDCTPRKGDGDDFFLVTDAELEAYSVAHGNSHVFDPSLYPERAAESLQDQVDYDAPTLVRPQTPESDG